MLSTGGVGTSASATDCPPHRRQKPKVPQATAVADPDLTHRRDRTIFLLENAAVAS
jgi:hypothetical protein